MLKEEEVVAEVEENDDDEVILRKKKTVEQKNDVTEENVLNAAVAAIKALGAKSALIQCMADPGVTNFVTSAVKSLGSSAAIVEDMSEASQFTSAIDSLLINVGSVTKAQTDAMRAAVSHANMGGKPWVLDPARVGALPLRTFTAKELMRRYPAIIRGNADEINFLVTNEIPVRGVGTAVTSDAVAQSALRLASVTRAAVIVSGANDYVALEGMPLVSIENGSEMMARVSGLGCVHSALAAMFIGVMGSKARWESAVAASLMMSVAGELAAAKSKGPGSFVPAFIDALYAITPEDVLKNAKVKVIPVN